MSGSEIEKYALIVAGGKGARMGSETPKQFLISCGKPILMKTIEAFHHYADNLHIVLVLHPELFSQWESLCKEHLFKIPVNLVEGGQERYHSVKNGLEGVPAGSLVAIHDGVRPMVSQRIIQDSFSLAERFGSAVPVTSVNETLRKISEGTSLVIDRSFLFSVQTPQTFRSDLIKRAYQQEYRPGFTDDASLIETMGEKVHFFPGDNKNIKITKQEDLLMAEVLGKS